jgi:hypothetical protein
MNQKFIFVIGSTLELKIAGVFVENVLGGFFLYNTLNQHVYLITHVPQKASL